MSCRLQVAGCKLSAANLYEYMKSYKDLDIYNLAYAQAQLNMISDIHYPDNPLSDLINNYEKLGRKINKFIQYVENNWK